MKSEYELFWIIANELEFVPEYSTVNEKFKPPKKKKKI